MNNPIVFVLALFVTVGLFIAGCMIWRLVVEPRLAADSPRHKAEPAVEPEPEPGHRPALRSMPFTKALPDSQPVTGSLAVVQARQGDAFPPALVVIHDDYLDTDKLRRR